MLRLILFRHAKADRPADLVDHERPLSISGRKQAQKMGEYIGAHQLIPDLVIVSSAKRTQETWAQARSAGRLDTAHITEPRIYESSLDNLLEVIRQQDAKHASIMLVGHNPGMERLTTWLAGACPEKALKRLEQGFVVGGLAVIDIPVEHWSVLDAQSGRLERFETPDTVQTLSH